jgi:hypothetical protein
MASEINRLFINEKKIILNVIFLFFVALLLKLATNSLQQLTNYIEENSAR